MSSREEVFSKVENIFQDVFDDESLRILDTTNSEDIEDWDSLNHINLVSASEKQFGIKFALGELETLKNVGDFVNLIVKKMGS